MMTKRILPCRPEIVTLNLHQSTADVTIQLVASETENHSKMIQMSARGLDTITSGSFQSNSAKDAAEFITALWDLCKQDPAYTLANMSRIGTLTVRFFPNVCRSDSVINQLDKVLNHDQEIMDAYLLATKSAPHKIRIGVQTPHDLAPWEDERTGSGHKLTPPLFH